MATFDQMANDLKVAQALAEQNNAGGDILNELVSRGLARIDDTGMIHVNEGGSM